MGRKLPLIAIVGRPNVGKSSLFNRLVGRRRAIVEDEPGVTRDRNYALVENFSIPFLVVDTGGFADDARGDMERAVADEVRSSVEEADVVFALFDGRAGVHPEDRSVVELLRPSGKPVYYLVNKCDGKEQSALVADFYELGIEDVFDLSALYGRGVVEVVEKCLSGLSNYEALLRSYRDREARIARSLENHDEAERDLSERGEDRDVVTAEGLGNIDEERPIDFAPVFFPEVSDLSPDDYERRFGIAESSPSLAGETEDAHVGEEHSKGELFVEPPGDGALEPMSFAIVGRPNVGKSTLFNRLVGEQRVLTSAVAGTTRDSIDFTIKRDGREYRIVDTAGLRKKARVSDRIERYSTIRAISSISDADVALVLIDALCGPGEQDAKIAGIAHETGKGLIIVVNKWDAIEKDHRSVHEFSERVRMSFKFASYAPILFVSAKTGKRCPRIIETVRDVCSERKKWVKTASLNRLIEKACSYKAPPVYRGRQVKVFYASQVDVSPPRFVLSVNYPRGFHFSYLRYLKNKIREEFGFRGTDIKLHLKRR